MIRWFNRSRICCGAAATLRASGRVAAGEANADIDRQLKTVAKSVDDEEALVETFKSHNALLQNSLSFFSHTIDQLTSGVGDVPTAARIGALSNSMGRFTSEPRPDIGAEITSRLDYLLEHSTSEQLRQDIATLVPHGRLIVATLPELDGLLSRLLGAPTAERARSVQDLYLELYSGAAARARSFRILLYVASLTLVVYIGYLLLRLRANARILQTRLLFENLVSGISTQFINLPRDRLDGAIDEALAQLAKPANVERAQIIMLAETPAISNEYGWCRDGIPAPSCQPDLLAVLESQNLEEYDSPGCLHIPQVRALADSPLKAYLESLGIKSWLCVPMWSGGKRLGFFSLDRTVAELPWSNEDIILLRAAGEIFANAIERERAQSEREALEARLQHTQRLEAVGTLAGGVAHEFNNVLGAVRGYSELAITELTGNDQVRRCLRQILVAGERAQRVVDQILAFSRRGERKCQVFRAQNVVAEAIDFIRISLPTTLIVETRLEADDATIFGDPTQLQQVVMNLCTNGAHAMDGRGTLLLHLDTRNAPDGMALTHGELPSAHYIRLAVQDTGHGIDEPTMQRIFEPFFTTKPAGSGTGLGLSTVHGIVTQHGGALNVRSQPGAGTTFEVYFPRSEAAALGDKASLSPIAYGGGETILLVDDESSLVLLGEEMLAALRYEPVGFDNPAAALASFRRNTQRFDLVLTDEVMPEMTGTELAMALHQLRPELPILLMTAYSGTIHKDRLRAAGVREVINKPLLPARLADCFARHLSRANGDGGVRLDVN
jgi:signal transduction histidine kinase/CheY-like chemotaxis protein